MPAKTKKALAAAHSDRYVRKNNVANHYSNDERRVIKEKFIRILRDTCNVRRSADEAGINRITVTRWRAKDESFSVAWDEALEEAKDLLEAEAWRRGVDGYDKPVTYQGEITTTYKEYSDRMLEILLKAHRPAFRERRELTGPEGGPVQLEAIRTVLVYADGEKDITPTDDQT